jgi:hypothetical protein
MAIVVKSQQLRRLQAVLSMVILLSLLALLMASTAGDHRIVDLVCFVLLPLFPFGSMNLEAQIWPTAFTRDSFVAPSPARPSLFQRPPPSTLA